MVGRPVLRFPVKCLISRKIQGCPMLARPTDPIHTISVLHLSAFCGPSTSPLPNIGMLKSCIVLHFPDQGPVSGALMHICSLVLPWMVKAAMPTSCKAFYLRNIPAVIIPAQTGLHGGQFDFTISEVSFTIGECLSVSPAPASPQTTFLARQPGRYRSGRVSLLDDLHIRSSPRYRHRISGSQWPFFFEELPVSSGFFRRCG